MKTPANKSGIDLPVELKTVLHANSDLLAALLNMPPSHQREYIKFVSEAKHSDTRLRRAEKVAQSIRRYLAEKESRAAKR